MSPTLVNEDGVPMKVVEDGDPGDPLRVQGGPPAPSSPQGGTGVASQPKASPEGETGPKATPQGTAPSSGSQQQPPAQPAQGDEGALTEDEQAALVRLDSFINAQVDERAGSIKEKVGKVQSGLNRQIADIKKAHDDQVATLTQKYRDLELKGVPEEERKALRETWDYEDQQRKLTKKESDLDLQYRDLMVATLLYRDGFEKFGVTEDDLTALDDPDQMEAFCWKAKAVHLEKSGSAPTGADAKKPVAPEQPPQKPAPAGASAPADLGGTGVAPKPQEFDPSQSEEAMAKNFSNLPKVRVKIK